MIKKGGPSRHQPAPPAGIAAVVPWSVPVVLDQIPDAGLHKEIEAPASALLALAELAEVRSVTGLSATFDVSKVGPKVHVTGHVRGQVGQTCVVTLEPMETAIDEPIDLLFAVDPAGATAASPDAEARRQFTDDEGPEPLTGNSVNLGAIASEFVVLAIDPYPRKEGAEFVAPEVEPDGPHPFAALEALKKSPGGGKP